MTQIEQPKLVGPVVRGMDSEIVDALLEAIEKDNPDSEIFYEDHRAYVRIHTLGRCRVTRTSLQEALGRPFELASLEPAMSSFAGRMKYISDEELIWYLERED
jgi:toluene monooxygenase system protein D